MDVTAWIAAELDDTVGRLTAQVFDVVPAERLHERPGGGNSILWGAFHTARHADLATAALSGADTVLAGAIGATFDERATDAGGGVDEAEQPWSAALDPGSVRRYLDAVLTTARTTVAGLGAAGLEQVPATAEALRRAGVPADRFDWLYRMWSDRPAAFLVRWPIIGHLANHTGEMIATRNRMGLSPF